MRDGDYDEQKDSYGSWAVAIEELRVRAEAGAAAYRAVH
jgi:hypothetical protein